MAGIKGTASIDTWRFGDKQDKLMKKMKFPAEFDRKVNMDKVSLPVINRWIAERILDLLGFEDDILVQFVFNILENAKKKRYSPDPKEIQIQITGFLERDARTFTEELWTHIISASRNPGGIPTSMLEATKRKLAKKHKSGSSRASRDKDEEDLKLEEARRKALEQSKVKLEETPQEEEIEQSEQLKEMLENIKKKQKEQDEIKVQKRAIPRSLADCFSTSIVAKAKRQEERERRIELKKIRAMQERLEAEEAERRKKQQEEEEKEAAKREQEAKKEMKSPKSKTISPKGPREINNRSRSRSRKRRRSEFHMQRERTPSTSPSPPREWLKKKPRGKKSSRRRRSASSFDSDE